MNRKITSTAWLIVVTLSLMLTTFTGAAAQSSEATLEAEAETSRPVPLIMLTEFNPWSMVLGADSPVFVLYNTGLVIYIREDADGDYEFASVQLSEAERDALYAEIVGSTDDQEAFFALDSYYDLALMTDQPSTTIYVASLTDPSQSYQVGVYGNLQDDDEARDQTPETYLHLYDAVHVFENPSAETWLPDYIEIILWQYDYSDPVEWLPDFPGLDDPMTVERDSVISLYLPIDELERYLKLVEGEVALLIHGETWTFSLRYPFPHEYEIS